MLCDRCQQPSDAGEHGPWKCPLEPRRIAATVVGDEIPGGMTIENMGPEPMTFYSKSEHRRKMHELGLVPSVRHVGSPGSDKSPHTSRWY